MATPEKKLSLETLASLCKRRGFIYPSSEIYGGLNGFWDYGPFGAELKRNLKDAWWASLVRFREDVVGLDATIIMHPDIWKASGHADGFADPMVDCKACKKRFRADQLCEEQGKVLAKTDTGFALPAGVVCGACGSKDLTEPRAFNLMFKSFVGPVEDASSTVFLRPETAQAIFVQFKNILDTSRQSVPFGVAQMGKSFRNEINPRNYTFRSREFEQMELEFFIRPDEAVELISGRVVTLADNPDLNGEPQADWGWEVWHKYWVEQRMTWYRSIGLPGDSLVEYWQGREELAHYARACVDIQYAFPFGVQELEGIAARSDFDLTQHQKHSGKSQEVFDEPLKLAAAKLDPAAREAFVAKTVVAWEQAGKTAEAAREFCAKLFEGRYLPHVIEPSAGADRLALAVLCNAYVEEWVPDGKTEGSIQPAAPGQQPPKGFEARTVMRFSPRIAPIKVAVFPLLKNKPELVAKARAIFNQLRKRWMCYWDETGAIGRRYRRQDEAGTPFCITIDFDTLTADTVTLRNRDSMKQVRIPVSQLIAELEQRLDQPTLDLNT
ncbi:MAG: glycine--tRNA ligase [Kiritimatiellia bacterium]